MTAEQDGMVRWFPAQEGQVVSLARVRAEQAERQAATASEAATDWQARAIRAEAAERREAERANFWHARSREIALERRREWVITWGAVALATVVVALSALVWLAAMGWPGLALLGGALVAAALVAGMKRLGWW